MGDTLVTWKLRHHVVLTFFAILIPKQGAIFVFYTRLLLSETEHLEFVHKVSMSSLFAFDDISSAFGGLI